MAELDRAAISTRIAEARDKLAGLTQPELAELLEVHWRTIQDWESPKNDTVPWGRLDEIAGATGVSKEWLLHGDQPGESVSPAELEAVLERVEAVHEDLRAVRALVESLLEDRARAASGRRQAPPGG